MAIVLRVNIWDLARKSARQGIPATPRQIALLRDRQLLVDAMNEEQQLAAVAEALRPS
jgi:hypothetical protein